MSSPEIYVEAALVIVDFEREGPDEKTFRNITHGLAFSLPEFGPSAEPLMFTVRSDPSPPWSPHSDLYVPFHISQDARMFVASLWVRNISFLDHLTLFIPKSTLLSRLDSLGPMSASLSLPWEAWGPTGSRMTKLDIFSAMGFDTWSCHDHGTKFIIPECSSRTQNRFTIQVFDFNQHSVKRAVSQGAKVSPTDISALAHLECDSSLCITAPTVFRAGEIFRNEVRTCLPYRWIAKVILSARNDCSAMCSEDSIILVDVSGFFLLLVVA